MPSSNAPPPTRVPQFAAPFRRRRRDSGKQVVLQGPSQYFASTPSGPIFRLRPDVTVLAKDGEAVRIYDT
ncbi:MAG: hypothetical protein WB689_30695, partial [Xanthobacteraceae bacterium]